jgi:sterol desaturase/sphingolipid hydroxylase (fatty acid hydroxylase superfamily)
MTTEFKSLAIFSSLMIFAILETIFPFFNYGQNLKKKLSANLILGLINVIIVNFTISWLLKFIWQQTSWLGLLHYIQIDLLKLIFSFLLLDGYMYLWHRLMHASYIGWRLHIVHHTENWMNVSTTYRFHTLEVLSSNLPKVFLIYLFGISYLLAYEALFGICLLFHHSNWNLSLKIDKIFSYLIVTPNYHRAHHSQSIRERQSNYASLFSVWDWLFKTRYYPQSPQSIKLGVGKEIKNPNVINLLKLPFYQ